MGIILTSDKRKCPEIANLEVVNVKTIRQYEGNTNVKALICSRDVARVCQHMNIPNLKVIQLFSAAYRQRMGAFYGSGARLFRFGQLCGAILFRMQRISLLFEVQYTR